MKTDISKLAANLYIRSRDQKHAPNLDIPTIDATALSIIHDPLLGKQTFPPNASTRTEIVFIESNVGDVALLLEGIGVGKEVHVINANLDGLSQITEILAGRSNIDAIHIISHGKEASINLGTLFLDKDNINSHTAQLQAIGQSLNKDGDIMLYGCDIAAGTGQTFINQLAIATGADVAASNNTTGSAKLHGDWDLEVKTGHIETQPAVSPGLADLYSSVLNIASATVIFTSGSANFTNTGGTANSTKDVTYKVAGDAAYVLRIDGLNTGVYADPSGGYVNIDFTNSQTETMVTLSFQGGQVFSAGGVKIQSNYAQTLIFKGYDSSGSQVGSTQNFAFTATQTQVLTFSGLTNIATLKITSSGSGGNVRYFTMDDLALTNIQPGTSITSATYDANTGVLSVTGSGITNGGTIDVSKLSLTGQGGTYTLTTPNVTASSSSAFSVTLSATDKIAVNGILNNNGTTSATGATTFNLAAAANWDVTAAASADLIGNVVTVSNVTAPTLESATYDANTGTLIVTGTNLVRAIGSNNDITANKISIRGEGNVTYVLTDTSDVDITSATSFTLILSAADKAGLNQYINKNGTLPTSASSLYLVKGADDWNTVITGGDIKDIVNNFITVSNVQVPTITSATYNASTGSLVVTGTGFTHLNNGGTDDIVANKFTMTGEGGSTYTLTNTANVEITSDTTFTLLLSATDKSGVNQIINKNGASSTGGTTYNLAAAEDWAAGADPAVVVADLTGNGITATVAAPIVTSATYDASTGTLVVTGTGFTHRAGAANDIIANKFTLTGQGGSTYALTDTANVEITSDTSFTLVLSATDKAGLRTLLNNNGTQSVGGTTYNLAAADDWANGADAALNIADLTGNGITVSNVVSPTITSAAYDASTGILSVTGTNLANGDTIDVSKLSVTGQAGSYTLTTTNVTATSSTAFAVTLNATDKLAVNGVLNNNGTTAVDTTTFNLSAAAGWDTTINATADLTGNGVTVSNVTAPTITSATYDGTTHVFTITGTNLVKTIGATNDITISKLTITGEGGATRTLSTTGNVEVTSDTSFTFTLAGTDIAAVDSLLNKNGTASASSSTTYNIAAADDWNSAITGGNIADLTGNGITVSNAAPSILSSTYDAATGILSVSAVNIVGGDTIDVSKLSITGQAGSYTLTTPNVTASSSTAFAVTLNAVDKLAINGILNNNGTTAVDTTTFNLAAAASWDQTTASGADLTGNAVTVSNVTAPTITSATYNGNTHVFTVTGTNLVKTIGATNDVTISKLTITGEGGATYTLSTTGNVEVTSATSFTFTLSGADIGGVDALLNKNGTSAVSSTTYNIAAADDWNSVITGGNIQDLTGNGITVTNAAPSIISATYDAATGILSVSAVNIVGGDTIDVSKLSLTGQAGSYTLTTANVTASSSTAFAVTLNATDKLAINGILNNNGTAAVDTTTFNLAAAASWNATTTSSADLTGNAVTVSNVTAPTVTSATYDGTTNILAVTGTNLVKTIGATNDVTMSKLTITGEGGATYTLSTTGNVEVTSATSFTVTLAGADIGGVNAILNKNGTSSVSSTTYNLAVADDWNSVITGGNIQDLTGNGITVSNAAPSIISSTYDAASGILSVTAVNIVGGDTIDVSKLSLVGQAGGSYTLTTANVTASSSTAFAVTLNAADKLAVNGLLNKTGTTAADATTFNLAAAASWDATTTSSADLTGNAVTVSNVAVPTITSATYDVNTHVLTVTGTGLVSTLGATNDITVSALTIRGEGAATRTLSTTGNVEVTSATSFAVTLAGADQAAVEALFNKNGTTSTGGTTYNLAAADDWDSVITGGNIAVTTAPITVSNVAVPTITSSVYNASTGVLTVTGTGLTGLTGANNDIIANKFSLQGEGGASYTLTTTSNVEVTSATSFTLTLSAADRLGANLIMNKNGTSSTSVNTYNLIAAEDWDAGADAAVVIADLTGNGITVTNVVAPTVTSATYNVATGVLVVTGNNFLSLTGANNDITANRIRFLGQGAFNYTLTNTPNVDITSNTSFTMTMSANDKAQLALRLNKDGTASSDSTTYNIGMLEDWNTGAATAVVIADLFGNFITVTGNNVAPLIGGVVAGQAVTETTTVSPFATVTITDPDVGASETIIITLDVAAKGTFTAASLATTGFSTADGGLTYTRAAGSPAAVEAAIRGLVFQPAAGRASVGGTETTTFTISANDGIASAVLNNTTTVIATGVNAAPTNITLSNAAIQQGSAANTSVGTLTATDPNPGDTAAFTLVAGNGTNDKDNSKFSISGNSLVAKNPVGMTPGNYTIFVRATDVTGSAYEKSFTIAVGDNVAPIATSIARIQPENTSLATVDYKVTFSESVSGVNAAAFALATTGTVAGTISSVTQLDPSNYSVRITGLTGDGTLGLNLKGSGTGIVDTSTLPLNGGFTGQLYQVDHTAPTTAIGSVRLNNDDGVSGADFITTISEQTILGTLTAGLQAGETVQISLDNGANWINAATALGSTSWSLPNQTLTGSNTLKVRVTDLAGNSSREVVQPFSINNLAGNTNSSNSDDDGDGIAQGIEEQVPNRNGVGKGDGNGDGIADSQQSNVSSLIWAEQPNGKPSYVTLMSTVGMVQTAVKTISTPANLTNGLKLPYGLLAFTIDKLPASGTANLSIFLEPGAVVNGYWKQNKVGQWVNIADSIISDTQGVIINFKLQDGGEFDADGIVNGKISDPGGPGLISTTSLTLNTAAVTDYAPRNAGTVAFTLKFSNTVKNVDLSDFKLISTGSARGQISQVTLLNDNTYQVIVNKVAGDGSLTINADLKTSDIVDLSGNSLKNNAASVAHPVQQDMALHTNSEKIAALYALLYNRAPDQDGLNYWLKEMAQGKGMADIAKAFTSVSRYFTDYAKLDNKAFVETIYLKGLGNAGDAQGISYWTSKINGGQSRSDMLSEFALSTITINLVSALDSKLLTNAEYLAATARQNALLNRIDVGLEFVKQFGTATNPIAALDSDPAYRAAQLLMNKLNGYDDSLQKTLDSLHATQSINEINTVFGPPVEAVITGVQQTFIL
ncbi:DUF4347 domain-containing protein [Undibacterium sp. Di24W]|uniref:DUF4347 domain-containing protein n=1 Tax=Undibacterium sp. Di24W TaxID=3413033 RepID=UPI003BF36F54